MTVTETERETAGVAPASPMVHYVTPGNPFKALCGVETTGKFTDEATDCIVCIEMHNKMYA